MKEFGMKITMSSYSFRVKRAAAEVQRHEQIRTCATKEMLRSLMLLYELRLESTSFASSSDANWPRVACSIPDGELVQLTNALGASREKKGQAHGLQVHVRTGGDKEEDPLEPHLRNTIIAMGSILRIHHIPARGDYAVGQTASPGADERQFRAIIPARNGLDMILEDGLKPRMSEDGI
jgi:hypothetical protein